MESSANFERKAASNLHAKQDSMLKNVSRGFRLVCFLLPALAFAQPTPQLSPPQLSTADEIRAGDALFAAFQKSQGFADTPESKAIEVYLQRVGDKVAQNAKRKLPYKFHLDPHPGFRSAVGYPGGQIVVGGGVLALMQHEDELAVVLGHEIEHIDLMQGAQRVVNAMQKDHLTPEQFDKLSIDDFGNPYGEEGELAADREGLKLAVAAGYSPQAAVELLEVFQFFSRDAKPAPPRKDSPSIEERIQQARDEIKSEGWSATNPEKPLDLP
jgi:predicted Zn-dependent protease